MIKMPEQEKEWSKKRGESLMEDLDILVAPARCEQARQILLSLGYFAPPASSRYDRLSHHLPGAQREDSGHTVCIELHREVFTPILNCPLDFSHLDRPFAQFLVDGVNVAHLGDARPGPAQTGRAAAQTAVG